MKAQTSLMLSFEFFPPKTLEGMQNLSHAALQLQVYQPHFMSVTFGAGGSTRSGTLETVTLLQEQTGIAIAPHLSCIGSTETEIDTLLQTYQAMNVRRLVALRGDVPSGMMNDGQFHYASELVELIRRKTNDYFHIEVAAYPEFHPQAQNAYADIENLKRKYEAGANSAITQYFFNPDAYFYYLDECHAAGIDFPIVPGIMPITQYTNLARFSDNCGAEIPRWIRKRLEAFGDDLESIQLFGLDVISELCQQLVAGGAPGLHFYTLNKDKACREIIEQTGLFTEQKSHLKVLA